MKADEIGSICHICGIPLDAGYFDESNVFDITGQQSGGRSLAPGQEIVLARYELPRNYCGILMSFAQYTNQFAKSQENVRTPGYQWQIRCDGQPRAPYLTFDHIINPWGQSGIPVYLRLEEGCLLEFVIRNIGASGAEVLNLVGGRITGRYWYNTEYGALNRL